MKTRDPAKKMIMYGEGEEVGRRKGGREIKRKRV